MFRTILARLRDNQLNLRQGEKMAQLGTLTAGIAHELNNPAAAVKRSSEKLIEAIKNLDGAYGHISHLGFDEPQWGILNSLVGKVIDIAYSPPEMDALTRSDMEAEIENWLTEHDIDQPWQIAPNLVNLLHILFLH
jgi:signal transduction histidine kinase